MDFADSIRANRRTTWLLLFAFFVLLALVASVASIAVSGGVIGAAIGIGIAAVMAWTGYVKADSIALSSTRARPADPQQFAQLHNVVEEMAIASGIPKPRVYVVDDPSPNAFATGKDPDHAAVAVTSGLLAKLERDELQGVLAHELAHIRNYDIRVMTVAVATAGSIALITDIFWRLLWFGGGRRGRDREGGGTNPLMIVGFILVLVLAPLAAAMLKAAISRRREALADASAIQFTRYPTGLRKALEKLDADSTVVRHTSHATSHLWIETPDSHDPGDKGRRFNDMFDTHPPLRERINLLRQLEGLPAYGGPDPEVVARLAQRSGTSTTLSTDTLPSNTLPPNTMPSNTLPSSADGSAWDSVDLSRSAGTAAAGAAPGWYQDPSGIPNALRYWDGTRWTNHLSGGR